MNEDDAARATLEFFPESNPRNLATLERAMRRFHSDARVISPLLPMLKGARVAVVIPAFHESARVGGVITSMPDWVDVIIVVDDASADATSFAARNAGTLWVEGGTRRCDVVTHTTNRGVGAAIVTGYRRALDHDADVIAVMAGDGQMDPGDLASVVTPVVDGRADYVKGNRFVHADRRRMPLQRRIAGKGLAAATRLATGLDIDDSQCGYTALSARAARALPLHELWPRYGYPNDLLGLLAASKGHVLEVPVRPVYAGEQSGIRFWHAAVVLLLIARRWRLTLRASKRDAHAPSPESFMTSASSNAPRNDSAHGRLWMR